MNGIPMIEFLIGNEILMKNLIEDKISAINNAKGNFPVYVETNHTFIKGFGWYICSLIPQEEIGVIFIERDKKKL
ncbi:hypothetical protein WJR50_07270 [Catalinimonas sp. 4WD22]|uniref:hypothetical protein n=1 Tax=Catalinimonas locisalis TaxID=3133978 RepID=UPI003100E4E2